MQKHQTEKNHKLGRERINISVVIFINIVRTYPGLETPIKHCTLILGNPHPLTINMSTNDDGSIAKKVQLWLLFKEDFLAILLLDEYVLPIVQLVSLYIKWF